LGEIVENIMTPDIYKLFNRRDYKFTRASRDQELYNPDGNFYAEIDVFVENGDYALAIEVKTKLKHDHIIEHIERMNKLRKYADAHNDKRKYIGAVASVIVPDHIRAEAIKAGFFVIEANEDNVSIKNTDDFKPKEW
jgi:predicted AAA+ superfamily ATPase